MSIEQKKLMEDKAKTALQTNGLSELPEAIQKLLIARLVAVFTLQQLADNAYRFTRGMFYDSDDVLAQKKQAIMQEGKALTEWISSVKYLDKLPQNEREEFILRAYQSKLESEERRGVEHAINFSIIKALQNDPLVTDKVNLQMAPFGDPKFLTLPMKILYDAFQEKLKEVFSKKLLFPSDAVNLELKALLENIKVAIQMNIKGSVLQLAKDWAWKETMEANEWRSLNEEAFLNEIFELLEFDAKNRPVFTATAKSKMDELVKEIPDFEKKYANEYQQHLTDMTLLEEALAKQNDPKLKKIKFDQEKFEIEKQRVETQIKVTIEKINEQILQEAVDHAIEQRFGRKTIQAFDELSAEEQKPFRENIMSIERRRLEFERQYKVKLYDDSQFGMMAALAGVIGLGDRAPNRNAILKDFTVQNQSIRKKIRANIEARQIDPLAFKNLSPELASVYRQQLRALQTDAYLIKQSAWQHISDTTINELKDAHDQAMIRTQREKYIRGKLFEAESDLKPQFDRLEGLTNEKVTALQAQIEMAAKIEKIPGFEAFAQLPPDEKCEAIKLLYENTKKLEDFNKLQSVFQTELNHLKNPQNPRVADLPTLEDVFIELKLRTEAEKIAYLETRIQTTQANSKSTTEKLINFTKSYYKDPVLQAFDKEFGYEETPERGLVGVVQDAAGELAAQVWYSPRFTAAIQGGLASGYLGIRLPLLGPMTGLYSMGLGALVSAVNPDLVRPLVAAAGGMAVAAAIPGAGLAGGLAAAGAGIVAQQALDQNPYMKQVLTNAGKKLWHFVLNPIREFADAYKKYKKGNKLYNGLRMVGIILGGVLALAGFIALNVVTAGIPVIAPIVASVGIIGLTLVATAGANLGAYLSKKMVRFISKMQTGFEDSEKYLLDKQAVALLGKNKNQKDNAYLLSRYFERKIKEMNKIVIEMEKNSKDPAHDRALGEAKAYLEKISTTMDNIRDAKNDPIKLKGAFDQYVKDEYTLKRTEYNALTAGLALPGGIKDRKKIIEDLKQLKTEMGELSFFKEMSTNLTVVIAQSNAPAPAASREPTQVQEAPKPVKKHAHRVVHAKPVLFAAPNSKAKASIASQEAKAENELKRNPAKTKKSTPKKV